MTYVVWLLVGCVVAMLWWLSSLEAAVRGRGPDAKARPDMSLENQLQTIRNALLDHSSAINALRVASGQCISREEWAEERCKDWEQASRNRKQGLDDLARALGYEWKRTEAKEGWEKKSVAPFGFGIVDYGAYKKAIEDSIAAPIWVRGGRDPREYDWTLPTTNRRKADRRKPLYTAQDAKLSSADLGTRKPAKKRRATH